MRGLFFAVVDEADSIFIDEARTPLILSAELPADDDGLYLAALELVRQLEEGRHYRIREADRAVELTERGCRVVADLSEGLPQLRWRIRQAREQIAAQAIAARRLSHRYREVIMREGKGQNGVTTNSRLLTEPSVE